MANRNRNSRRKVKPYLTKRITTKAAQQGFRTAAKETVEIMGYNIVKQDGWVVKKYSDGRLERLTPIQNMVIESGRLTD